MRASHRTQRRPALVALVVVAVLACLALAWWQWSRFESAAGTGQNLGYALQWPAFAVFVVYAYRRFVVLESDPDEAAKISSPDAVIEIPDGVLPRRPAAASAPVADDDSEPEVRELAEYNRYLSELAQQEKQ